MCVVTRRESVRLRVVCCDEERDSEGKSCVRERAVCCDEERENKDKGCVL